MNGSPVTSSIATKWQKGLYALHLTTRYIFVFLAPGILQSQQAIVIEILTNEWTVSILALWTQYFNYFILICLTWLSEFLTSMEMTMGKRPGNFFIIKTSCIFVHLVLGGDARSKSCDFPHPSYTLECSNSRSPKWLLSGIHPIKIFILSMLTAM